MENSMNVTIVRGFRKSLDVREVERQEHGLHFHPERVMGTRCMRSILGGLAAFLIAITVGTASAQEGASEQEGASDQEGFSLEKAAQKSNNPVSDAWALITQNDYSVLEGAATGGSSEVRNILSIQPLMPVPIRGGDWNLVNRVILSAISAPLDDDLNSADPFGDRTFGLGDTVVFSLAAPNRDDGFIWAVGPSFILPTATEDVLGQEKWQAGPAILAARLGKDHGGFGIEHFNIGVLAQHWWSFAGTDRRASTSQSNIQYFINWKRNATQLIGMTPNIQIDWKRSGSDRFSVPIGIGTIDLFFWGKTPVRWGVELQYYVMQPDPVGLEWNLKIFFAPIKPNPFKK
jgi:hypothetical protein